MTRLESNAQKGQLVSVSTDIFWSMLANNRYGVVSLCHHGTKFVLENKEDTWTNGNRVRA
jgi:hypothetical protein